MENILSSHGFDRLVLLKGIVWTRSKYVSPVSFQILMNVQPAPTPAVAIRPATTPEGPSAVSASLGTKRWGTSVWVCSPPPPFKDQISCDGHCVHYYAFGMQLVFRYDVDSLHFSTLKSFCVLFFC